MPREPEGGGNLQHDPALAQRLVELGYIEIFHRLDEDALNSVWGEPGAPDALERLALDPGSSDLARFLAAEILFYKRPVYPPEHAKKRLAGVYAAALARDFTQMANPWGLPGQMDGLAGRHFVALGEDAVPELSRLLDDETEKLYAGSREAALGNSYRYRVKDLAAFYIGEVRHVPLEVHEDPGARDEEIAKLRNSLGL